MIQLSPSRNANLLALAAILGILGTFSLVWESGAGIAATAGPSVLAAAGDEVHFVAGGSLYRTGADGALRETVPLAALGLDGMVSGLAVLGEELLIAEGRAGRVLRCAPARRACVPFLTEARPHPDGALALAVAPEARRVYVADSSRHQLHAYDLSGRPLYRLDIEGGLKYPNEVVWLGDERLLIADTNHHRIIVVRDEGGGHTRLDQRMDAKTDLGRGNTWPTAAARDGADRTWVINSNGLLRNGEVIVFDGEGNARHRIDLGAGADPIALAAVPDAVVLADYDHYRLQRVALADLRVTAFGDAALEEALRTLQEERAHWQRMRHLGFAMMVLFGLLGAAAGYLDWKARRARAAGSRRPGEVRHPAGTGRQAVLTAAAQMQLRPDARGIVWLGPNPKFLRMLDLLMLLIGVMFAAMFGLLATTFETLPWNLLAMMAAMTAAVLGGTAWGQYRMRRLRIGTDGHELHVVDILGRQGHGAPEAFIHTGRRLLLGRIAVPLPQPRAAVFEPEAFAALIGPLLERVPRSNEMAILWRDLRRGDPFTWAGFAALVLVLVLQVWLEW